MNAQTNACEQASILLAAVGKGLGVELALDAHGASGLRIDNRLDVTLRVEAVPPAILLYAVVGQLPEKGAARETALERLLAANHLWEASRGATWTSTNGDAVLERLIPLAELDADTLARELARFTDVALVGQDALVVAR